MLIVKPAELGRVGGCAGGGESGRCRKIETPLRHDHYHKNDRRDKYGNNYRLQEIQVVTTLCGLHHTFSKVSDSPSRGSRKGTRACRRRLKAMPAM